jgi:hypothetical protein
MEYSLPFINTVKTQGGFHVEFSGDIWRGVVSLLAHFGYAWQFAGTINNFKSSSIDINQKIKISCEIVLAGKIISKQPWHMLAIALVHLKPLGVTIYKADGIEISV